MEQSEKAPSISKGVMHKVFFNEKKQYIFMQVKLTLSPAGDWNKGIDRETLLQDWRDTEGVGQEGNGGGRTV